MLRVFSLISFVIGCLALPILASAVESEDAVELSIRNVKVMDSATVRVAFSEDIDMSSLVLKITKQSDNSSISLADMKEVQDAPEAIDILLEDELIEGTSYTLTVLAAVSIAGSTIVDGAQALREFVTPSPLKKAQLTLSAPPNPSAVSVDVEEPVEVKPTVSPVNPPKNEPEPSPTEELPLTGANPLIFILFALPLAYLLLRRRSI